MAGTLTVTGLAAGLASGEKIIGPLTATGTALISTIVSSTLASGDNTFSVPDGAVAALIVFPTAITATVKVRLNSDTGGCTVAPVSSNSYATIPLISGCSSIILNASAAVSTYTEISFI